MNLKIEKLVRKPFRIAWLAAFPLLSACATTAGLQSAPPSQTCPPDCTIDIVVRDTGPPEIPDEHQHRTRVVAPDQQLAFKVRGGGSLVLVFEKESPFKSADGRPIYIIPLPRAVNSRAIRTDGNACRTGEGCKYLIYNRAKPTNPPLDPWIIIDY